MALTYTTKIMYSSPHDELSWVAASILCDHRVETMQYLIDSTSNTPLSAVCTYYDCGNSPVMAWIGTFNESTKIIQYKDILYIESVTTKICEKLNKDPKVLFAKWY